MTTLNQHRSSPSSPDASNDRTVVMSAWTRLRRLFESENRGDLLKPLEPMMQRYELGIFRLVVMGEIKKGKSSFINALLGEANLLPTDSDVATSTVYKVIYGPQRKFKVFFLPDVDTGKRQSPLEIEESQLADFGTENGNPNNEKRVDFIGVELPHPLLRQGLVVVDTPGVGGLHRSHRRISRQYAPNADAVFFVLDSVEAVISADEISFLQDLYSNVTKRIFFVQTKTDAADCKQVEAWQTRNKQLLIEKLGIPSDRLYYFTVSSKLKRIADERHDGSRLEQSGFLAVLDFLHHGLMAAKDRQLSADIARKLVALCDGQVRDIQQRVAIYQQQSQTELNRLQHEYQEVRRELERWSRTVHRAEIQKFGDRFNSLKRKKQNEIQDLLDPGGQKVLGVIEELRQSGNSPNQLAELAEKIQQDWVADAADAMGRLQHEFNQEFIALIDETTKALTASFIKAPGMNSIVGADDFELNKSIDFEKVTSRLGIFEQSRAALYGAMAAAAMANIAVFVGALVFPPLAAVGFLATLAAAAVGGKIGHNEIVERKKEEVLMKIQSALSKLARVCQRRFFNKFSEIADDCEREARKMFKSAADQAQETVQQRLNQLEQVRSQTREQSREAAEALQQKLGELTAVEKQLRAIMGHAS